MTSDFSGHSVISTSPIFATNGNDPTITKNNFKKLMKFKVRSAAGLLRSIFLVLLGICILGAEVLGEIVFLAAYYAYFE